MKIKLIQVWFGNIPDYFWFHYETTKNLNIDFLFVTDQDLKLDSPNYKVLNLTKKQIELKLSQIFEVDFIIKNNKKTCDLKAAYGDIFQEYLLGYDYVGCYDIDVLFGDVHKYLNDYLGVYDFISIGNVIHNRLSGPFLIYKNSKELRELYKCNEFIRCFDGENVESFEENILNTLVKDKYSVKLIDSINVDTKNSCKNDYEAIWSGGKVFVKNEEKFLYHFYRKEKTKLQKLGNIISAKYDKKYLDDFLWVVHFSENYETLLPFLMDSLKKYSNRKCIFYSINYTPQFIFKTQFECEQFIFRRIDIEPGNLDERGRSVEIMNSKPVILMDVIKSFPNKKFVHIDTDIYLTTNADDITKYFDRMENYPLMNSHIHDVMYISNLVTGEEWSNPLEILMRNMEITNEPIFPRRKCNIIVFDEKSYWFFEEQMEVYNKFKNSNVRGIFAIFDEDTANALLAKYNFKMSLPLIDIEESHNLSVDKIHNYSYSMTGISPWVELPKTINDFLFFHGFKHQNDYIKIQEEYGSSTLENEEMVLEYKDNTIFFEKNSFLYDKKIKNEVDFVLYENNNEILRLSNQQIYTYCIFYVSNIRINPGKYNVKILQSQDNRYIFNDIIEIK